MNTFTICLIIWASDKLTRLGRCQDVASEYIGCYEDGPTQETRIFTEYGKYLPEWNATDCRALCLRHHLFYYGISQKCMCFCGNSSSNYTQYGERDENQCEEHCLSDNRRIKVYEVQCPSLQHPENGNVSISHTTAMFNCDRGFELVGREEIDCIFQNNVVRWEGQEPSCVAVNPTVHVLTTSTTSTASASTRRTANKLITPTNDPVEEGSTTATTKPFQTTRLTTDVTNASFASAEDSTQDYLTQTSMASADSSSSLHTSANSSPANNDSSTSHGEDKQSADGILELFLHSLLAIIPVIVILFFILLACCCSVEDKKYRKRKLMGDTTCGPSSFEFMTPRVIKRQFSTSTLPMTYNRSFGIYNREPNLDLEDEIDSDDNLETKYDDNHVNFDLDTESNDNEYEEDGVIYV